MKINHTKVVKFNLELNQDEASKLSDLIALAKMKGVKVDDFLLDLESHIDEVLDRGD